jgi:spermidine synthase
MPVVPKSRIRPVFTAGPRWLPVLLLVSGFVAVVYEIIWQRQFALLFGSTAPATAAVLAAYFAGLGMGAWFVGRLASKWRRPLLAYAILEILIGVGALLVGPLIGAVEGVYPTLFADFSGQPGVFTATRVLIAFFTVLLPTFCMGGTLPVLGVVVDGEQRKLGVTAGWLYVLNTVGAGCGALAVPLLLLPHFGLRTSVWLCAAINGAIGVIAWWMDRRMPATAISALTRATPESKSPTDSLPLLLALVSGLVTFALQVLWNRAFAQIHENSMYSFAVIVAVVIFALALGAQCARVGLRRFTDPRRMIGGAWIAAGAMILVGPWLFLKVSGGLSYLPTAGGWGAHAMRLAGLASLVVLPPMTLLGIGLPALMQEVGNTAGATPRVLGRILAINVVGSVIGALAAGFLLPVWLGLWNGMLVLGTLLIAAGAWALWRRHAWVLGVAWGVSIFAIAPLDLPRVRVLAARNEQLLSITEGTHGITAVVARGDELRLKLNNHYRLGGTTAIGDERMQAHIPLLLHPSPKRVAFLGLGTGISASGALFHPVEHITVMELVPDVVSAARKHFRAANAGVLEDSRILVVADDARNYLRGSQAQFDVIIGDLVVPWRQGEGSLFTLEQFVAARRALAPDGIFCQWLPFFQLSEVEVNILARTFLTVFPHAQLWRGDFSPTEPAVALIGSAGDLKWDVGQLRHRLAEMKPDATNPQLRSPDAFWMNLVGDLKVTDLAASETRVNREDQPWVELLGPMLHTGGSDNSLFTGRRLQGWLDQVTAHSQDKLALLPAREATAVKAGRVLAEMTLCVEEEDRAGTTAAQRQLKEMLPAETFQLLFQ